MSTTHEGSAMTKNVHTEHCCAKHGCKYGAPEHVCTVTNGNHPQSYPCERCAHEREEVAIWLPLATDEELLAELAHRRVGGLYTEASSKGRVVRTYRFQTITTT